MLQTLTAQDLFRAAYDNRYTWDAQFPGYRAHVTLQAGATPHIGQIQVNSDLTFEVLGIADQTARRTINGQLWEMTIHRARRSFAETHGDNTFELGNIDETGTVEILMGGAAMGNRYRVRDNTVCFVHRQIRDLVVNIDTFSTLQTEAGYLSTGYRSIYLDPETGQVKHPETSLEDTFENIDGYYLLTQRLICTEENGAPKLTKVQFSNLELLKRVPSPTW